jgi:hypothetical protein
MLVFIVVGNACEANDHHAAQRSWRLLAHYADCQAGTLVHLIHCELDRVMEGM